MEMINKLNIILHDKIPSLILINFIMLIILIILNWSYIKKFLIKIDKKTWTALALIFVIALLIRIFIPPHHHIMYIDEALYMEAAKNMLQTGYQGGYLKSIGWPFILEIAFAFFGVSNWVALYTSTLFGALSIFTIFFMVLIITKRKGLSLIAALLFSFFPLHIRWSASAETNIASIFFISLAMFLCFLYFENKKNSLLWLALMSLAFTSQFRAENYVFPLLFLLGCIIYDKNFFQKINFKFVLPWLVLIILVSADFVQIVSFYTSTNWAESNTEGYQSGNNWSILNLLHNTYKYGADLFKLQYQPLIVSVLIIMGSIYMFSKQKKDFLFLLTWFILVWLIHFSSWFQTIGGRDRFYMAFYPITVIFASYGIMLIQDLFLSEIKKPLIKFWLLSLLIGVIVLIFVPYIDDSKHMYSDQAQFLETKIPELAEEDISSNCVIIANLPTILKSTTNLNVIDVNLFLNNYLEAEKIFNNTNCVLFFEDLTCTLWRSTGDNCKKIKNDFLMEPFISYTEGSEKYTFYKIARKM